LADKPLVIENSQTKRLPAATTLQTGAAGTGNASINMPHGTAPTSPVDGDCWTTTAGLFCRVNGATVGPFGTGGGGGGGVVSFHAGATSTKTYDPGTSAVALDSCSITVPGSSSARTFMVMYDYIGESTGFSSSHGVRSGVGVDGANVGQNRGWVIPTSGEKAYANGMAIVSIPGDSASHTIDLLVSDSGATGNLTFHDRWIFALQL
jgi:hypothetical protein